jgi:hypothetical protein
MRVRAEVIREDGSETIHKGIMRFAVLSQDYTGAKNVVAMFTNLAGAIEWQQKMYSLKSEVVALIRDAGDGVRGYPIQRDDNLDMLKKL